MKAERGSQKWLQVAVNEKSDYLNGAIRETMSLPSGANIVWLSPLAAEDYAEYRDEAFVKRLGLKLDRRPLASFWPRRGPVWDGLALTSEGDVLLVEAKAHIPEMVSPASQASPGSLALIVDALEATRASIAPRSTANWSGTFYQYTNRLAHLHLLRTLNDIRAHMVFLYFVGDADVGGPASKAEWEGAIKVTEAYLGLGMHKLSAYIHHVFLNVANLATKG